MKKLLFLMIFVTLYAKSPDWMKIQKKKLKLSSKLISMINNNTNECDKKAEEIVKQLLIDSRKEAQQFDSNEEYKLFLEQRENCKNYNRFDEILLSKIHAMKIYMKVDKNNFLFINIIKKLFQKLLEEVSINNNYVTNSRCEKLLYMICDFSEEYNLSEYDNFFKKARLVLDKIEDRTAIKSDIPSLMKSVFMFYNIKTLFIKDGISDLETVIP